MAEENNGGVGPERGEISGARLASMDSTKSRWIFQNDDDSEIEDDDDDDDDDHYNGAHHHHHNGAHHTGLDSEDEENADAEQRLVRTGPRVDSFDVEALEVPSAQRNEYYEDVSLGKRIILTFQTLGVVFGDVGTSPLYTFSVMFSKAPINGNEDVLEALSLVLYTLILIPLVKYVLVVLWANDDGDGMLDVANQASDFLSGGTFALYFLICQHAKVSLLPNQLPSDARISSFRLEVPSAENQGKT